MFCLKLSSLSRPLTFFRFANIFDLLDVTTYPNKTVIISVTAKKIKIELQTKTHVLANNPPGRLF